MKLEEYIHDIRVCMNDVIDFINANGGWNIIGWYRRGESKDATDSNNEQRNLAKDSTFHIIELIPNHVDLRNSENNNRYDYLQYDTDQLF